MKWVLDCLYRQSPIRADSIEQLEAHGVLGLVGERLPPESRRALQMSALRGELRRLDFLEIVDLLDRSRIPFVALKGPALAALVYDETWKRGFSDIDIAVPREHHAAAMQMLSDSGCRHRPRAYTHKTVEEFFCRAHGTPLDVHFTVSSAERFGRLFDELWRDRRPFDFEGRTLLLPTPEVTLIFLLVHLARHLNAPRAIWFEDIRRFLTRFEADFDWSSFVGKTRSAQVSNAVWVSMAACGKIFSEYGLAAQFPAGVIESVDRLRSRQSRVLYAIVEPALRRGYASNPIRRMYSLAIAESWTDRGSLLASLIRRRLRF